MMYDQPEATDPIDQGDIVSGCPLIRLREHLAKHFGDTYSRIGLPEPYPTE